MHWLGFLALPSIKKNAVAIGSFHCPNRMNVSALAFQSTNLTSIKFHKKSVYMVS